jgi:NDP-sugar pyrophosphorylase family protein
MLNIVLPMAGRGSRFLNKGFNTPKPLIEIHGKRMVQGVINNLTPDIEHQFIFICQEEHLEKYNLSKYLNIWSPNSKIITIDRITQGAACTVLLAEEEINNNNPLMIANSDQWIDCDINNYLDEIKKRELDGLIMTMLADDEKWSFVGLEEKTKNVTRVVEKEVISNEATVGIYNFRKGSFFCEAAKQMIKLKKLVNDEYYVAPAYNEMIDEGSKIGIYNIGAVNSGMYGLGTPEDLNTFLSLSISKQF